jgi:hypothetical protein
MLLTMSHRTLCCILAGGGFIVLSAESPAQSQPTVNLTPSSMPKIATVDPRYLSYNIEMVEVTGGRFWKPYNSGGGANDAAKPNPLKDSNAQVGDTSGLFQYRPPINLSDARLRKLAAALGPAYVRVSGTWANSTYFQNDDNPASAQPPVGFKTVLTRVEWKGVIDFLHSTDGQLVTSVAISDGTRDAQGIWSPAQAAALFDYTKKVGGSIAATEFMNEPTFPGPGGAPKGYDAAAFARDAKVFDAFLRKESPQTVFLGPGGIGEGGSLVPAGMQMSLLRTEDLLKATGPIFDAFSYHFYGTVSKRCGGKMTIDQALTTEWLDRTNRDEAFYASLRDKYQPGKPIWLNETAEAACGGDSFAGQFVDTFRFLNQLGALAQRDVKVVMHNTLAASDYGLLSSDTFEPRPDFWAALLWKRTMATTVLKPDAATEPGLRIYAQCMNGSPGGVTLLLLNTDTKQERSVAIGNGADRYLLTAAALSSSQVTLNGSELQTKPDGSIPVIEGQHVAAGTIHLGPASITFLTIPSAGNKSCN